MRFGLVIDRSTALLGLIRTLRGLTRKFGSFDDGQFDELRFEGYLSDNPAFGAARMLVLDPQACRRAFLPGDYAAAVDASLRAHGCFGHPILF